MKIRLSIIALFVALFALSPILTPTAAAADIRHDECWEFNTEAQCIYWYTWYEPEYEVWQYTEPNWCLYTTDDRVAVTYTQNGTITGWYVWHAGDPDAITGGAVLYVVNNSPNCYLSPW